MSEKTALHDNHIAANGKMVDFSGFSLPINYGSQIEEHHAVRQDAGMFDVSHMVVSDLNGLGSQDFLKMLLANDVAKLTTEGKALYSCMLNEQAGIVDDLIVYWLKDDQYRIVSNAATKEKDLAWMNQVIQGFEATLVERDELSMIAVQGPNAREKALSVLPPEIKDAAAGLGRFYGAESGDWFVGRTGYTGEDGFEIVTTAEKIQALWDALLVAEVRPCGLGARDTLRLEAGMMLYGSDMTETTTPFESGLKWTVSLSDKRDFIGKTALIEKGEPSYKMVGLTLKGKGIMRSHQEVVFEESVSGEVTSGGYSPTLDKSIGFARVSGNVKAQCQVQIRNRLVPATVAGVAFIKK